VLARLARLLSAQPRVALTLRSRRPARPLSSMAMPCEPDDFPCKSDMTEFMNPTARQRAPLHRPQVRPRDGKDDAAVSGVLFATPTHCQRHERNPHPSEQRRETAARVEQARRRALEQLALRVDRLTAVLAEARAELAAAARAGRAEGASIRAIAEAVGLSRPRVHEMLNATTEPLQAVGPMDVGPTCG
jgi:hypothetical protein